MTIRDEVLELLRTDPVFREEVRRQLLPGDLLALPSLVRELTEAQRRTDVQVQQLAGQVQQLTGQVQQLAGQVQQLTGQVQQLAGQVQQLAGQVQQLAGQVQQLAGQVQQLAGQVQQLAEQVQHLAGQVEPLVSWQRGEASRRDGERYEHEIIRRAPVLFNGGKGGSPAQSWVQRRLTALLGVVLSEDLLPAEEDPYLADLLWWKGEQVVVVEVSLQVDREDIRRAARRVATLQRAGATAVAVVIGEDWATRQTKSQAQVSQVEWKVGAKLSEGFLAFRRRPAT